MVPHVAKSGWSFRGSYQYYMHDKKSQTKERVGWTYTHNLPTDDPELAMRTMATTAMRAKELKQRAGIANTGRKMKSGPVYAYSLSWHPDQHPDKQTMLDAALETLHLLKLQEHEVVVVNHTDEPHDHVHVIVNLIHPETGKKAVVSYDYLTMSTWAEQVETLEGEIRCPQRVINNELRREQANENKQLALVKHRDKKVERAAHIQKLYTNTSNGHAFQSALQLSGYTLAEGHKGRYVVVDKFGEVHGLARQLEGQRAKHLRERFKDIKALPDATKLSKERNVIFDKEQYEIDRQKKMVDAAIQVDKKAQENKENQNQTKIVPNNNEATLNKNAQELEHQDAISAWSQLAQRQRHQLEEQQKEQYKRADLLSQIQELENSIAMGGWFSNKKAKRQELLVLQKNLNNIDQRIEEQNGALEQKIAKAHPDYLENIKRQEEQYNQRMRQHLEQRSNNLNKDHDLGR